MYAQLKIMSGLYIEQDSSIKLTFTVNIIREIWFKSRVLYCNFRIKTLISNLVPTTHFWNNLHQVRSKSKDWKAKYFKDKSFPSQKSGQVPQKCPLLKFSHMEKNYLCFVYPKLWHRSLYWLHHLQIMTYGRLFH